ncbi:MAG: hypothetical protein P9L97_06020 [Candidatus Tenebribacter davisii]|nr:hypothetical protein [Candidatus Tenebribacter davisii]
MGTLTNFATTKLVDHVFKSAYTTIATLYLTLCTTAPTVASTGSNIVETDYGDYARTSFTSTFFNAAALRKIVQALDIEFETATGVSASNITHYAICDALTGGNVLGFGSFITPWNVVSGNTPKIVAGKIEISLNASVDGFTDIAVHKMLNLMFRNVAWTTPSTTLHFGLAKTIIADAESMTDINECSGNNYARQPVPASSFDAAVAGVTTNNVDITFNVPTDTWGLVTSLIVVNNLSGTTGDLLAFDNTHIVDQTPTTDDTVTIPSGGFDCDLD